MSSRKIRRAAEHAARKQARKAGFPQPPSNQQPQADAAATPEPSAPKTTFTSDAQRAANRANSQHSTGARSAAGRAASSQNRTVHGLARHNHCFMVLDTEDQNDFTRLKASLVEEYNPVTATECILVNTMLESHWLANRAMFLAQTATNLETGLIEDPHMFGLYLRYETTHRRAFHKAMNDLLKLRKEMRKAENGFEAQESAEAQTQSDNKTQNPAPEPELDPSHAGEYVVDVPEQPEKEGESQKAAA